MFWLFRFPMTVSAHPLLCASRTLGGQILSRVKNLGAMSSESRDHFRMLSDGESCPNVCSFVARTDIQYPVVDQLLNPHEKFVALLWPPLVSGNHHPPELPLTSPPLSSPQFCDGRGAI
jgi:hypothetical protein